MEAQGLLLVALSLVLLVLLWYPQGRDGVVRLQTTALATASLLEPKLPS